MEPQRPIEYGVFQRPADTSETGFQDQFHQLQHVGVFFNEIKIENVQMHSI